MDTASATVYLGQLLNRTLTPETPLRLSSAQRARFNAWLHQQGLQRNDLLLAGEFTLAQLSGDKSGSRPDAPIASTPRRLIAATAAMAVGVDIQSVQELTANTNHDDFKADPELVRIFTLRELSYAQSRPVPSETLAGLFAAKEAIRKCVGGAAWSADAFRAVEVLPDAHGMPSTPGFSVSISHSAGMAVAIACSGAPSVASGVTPSNAPIERAPLPESASSGAGLNKFLTITLVVSIISNLALLARIFG